ncbi:TPA: hypothetical protein ACRFDF_001467 [Yersinia enterocolitica]|nr:hypothetical protein [Yersinia enterocolitica]HDL6595938.1 hypothetical protein [Yersinia enterocolitica]HDZ9578916.1 hypothetical protein [Yersinia enterocolitica]HEB5885679.1 hypothetical protein [Yersinia enterocolitica]
MFYFLRRRAEKKIVKKANEVLTDLEAIYLNEDYFVDGVDLDATFDYTEEKLDELAKILELNEEFLLKHHPDIIERANDISRISLACVTAYRDSLK